MRSRILVLLAALPGIGCGFTVREATAVQPNPILARESTKDIPKSVPLTIYQRNYNFGGIRFGHWAQFVAVSRDRLRFHVGKAAFSQFEADTDDLSVYLEDNQGHRVAADDRQGAHINWYYMKVLNQFRRGYETDVFEGVADYVFYSPNLISRERKDVTLVVHEAGFEYRYKWTFADGTEVHNWGYGDHERENGEVPVPGPYTQYRGTIYPDR